VKTLLAVTASAALYGLAFPPFDLAELSWVALVPLLLVLRSAAPAAAAAWSAAWAALAAAAVIPWLVPTLHGHFELSLAESAALYALVCLLSAAPFYGAALGAWAYARAHLPGALGPGLFAAAWVTGEYARAHLGLSSPWLKLGDSQHGAERVRQLAAVLGVYGVSGLVALGNAAAAEILAVAVERRRGAGAGSFAPAAGAACMFALALGAALVYGAPQSSGPPPGPGAPAIAVVHGSEPAQLRWKRATAARVLRHYGEPTRDLLFAAETRPSLVIWPENALQTPIDEPSFGSALRSWSREAPLLLGAPRHEGPRVFNSAFLIGRDGATLHYDKRRLLPFSETHPFGAFGALPAQGDLDAAEYAPGTKPGLFAVGGMRVGVLICLEALYPALARELAEGGATVLVNLSNEGWYRGRGASEQQLAQSVFRAIETRLPLVRATSGGVSAFVAPDGTVVARSTGAMRTLVAPLPAAWPGPSLYTRWGDGFAQACAAAWLLAFGYSAAGALAGARKRRHASYAALDG
jgi:apolipoprotein N-acyltransferase